MEHHTSALEIKKITSPTFYLYIRSQKKTDDDIHTKCNKFLT